MQDFCEQLCKSLGISIDGAPELLNPLVLAFIGDTIFDLAVRMLVMQREKTKVHQLHVCASQRVRASAQAQAIHEILPLLSAEEEAIYKRARNAKPGSVPKNATIEDYCAATGLEALLGYLFLSKQQPRMLELIHEIIDAQVIQPQKQIKVFKPGGAS